MLTGKQLKSLATLVNKSTYGERRVVIIDNKGSTSSGSPCARLWCTDGHCAVLHTVEGAQGPTDPIAYDCAVLVKLAARDIVYIEDDGRLRDTRGPLPISEVIGGSEAPDLDSVTPEYRGCRSSDECHGFAPPLMQRVMKTLIATTPVELLGASIAARFQLGVDSLSPTKIEYGPTMALVMPCRL